MDALEDRLHLGALELLDRDVPDSVLERQADAALQRSELIREHGERSTFAEAQPPLAAWQHRQPKQRLGKYHGRARRQRESGAGFRGITGSSR
jgi:hypothetical protein